MRFKKGSKVEVFNEMEVPSGSWRCAEIISGNGHNYSVKYDCPPGIQNESTVERVPMKAIRPCPPPVDRFENWAAGDVVEVYDGLSWKTATVLKVMAGDYYLVRPLGSSREFHVRKAKVRVRLSWQDNKWVLVGKGSGCEIVKSNKILKLTARNLGLSLPQANRKQEVHALDNNYSFQESRVFSAGTLKRASLFLSSDAQACKVNAKKMRAIKGEHARVTSRFVSSPKKVDAVAYPQKNLGETYMHSSYNSRTNGSSEVERGNLNCVVKCFLERSSEANDSDIYESSVGSCSVISNSQNKLSCGISSGQDADSLSGDAESFYVCGDEEANCPVPLGEDLSARIHNLELHAYRRTLEALYASGPLSWEQEVLLTNLRLSLHISNDEHLIEGQCWRHAYLASKGLKTMLGFTTFPLA